MSSFKRFSLFACAKTAALTFSLLPMGFNLWMGRCMGWAAGFFMAPKSKIVYANLKTAFAADLSPSQLRQMTREVFMNFIQSVVEFISLPKMKRLGLETFVEFRGKENIDAGMAQGKGVILLAIHSGSWELASVVGAAARGPYHIVANDQSRFPHLGRLLNDYRTHTGANVITAGTATKEIIKAMQRNEVVSLVLDQGGKTGLEVPFFGKTASMSTGAMRLALKYGCAVCPVWIERLKNGKHVLTISPAMPLAVTGDIEKDLKVNISKAAAQFEQLLKEHPAEYTWFYKVFKYSNHFRILILDDGRTGHLRQSQALASNLTDVMNKRGKSAVQNTVSLQWKGPWVETVFPYFVFMAQHLGILNREDYLRYFLMDSSYKELMTYKADYVISCGWLISGANFILSRSHLAKSITILTPLISPELFDVVVMPEHDRPKPLRRAHLITPKVSPNLINAAYLKQQSEGLMKVYTHLKASVRTKFGVLIGGNAKGVTFDEAQIRQLLEQIKESALHYNADILLTTSRRTPEAIEQIISKELKNFERCSLCILANQRNFPETVGGILGLSDLVIVSGESISMVSEALSSGKRTIVFSPNGRYGDVARDKYEDFVLKLNEQGYLMVTSVDDLKSKIWQLLSRKITLNAMDDQSIIQSGLGRIV
jgi:KDO2-lipid IV(A) lauroyltransferase